MTKDEIQKALDTMGIDRPLIDYGDWILEHFETIRAALQAAMDAPKVPDGSKCNLCHKDMINLINAYDMIKYLLPLAKGYVHANPGIRSTECIIEDAEAILSAAPTYEGEK